MTLRHDATAEQRQRIEWRIFRLLNRVDYDTRISTYAAMSRAARNRGEDAVREMAQVERNLKAVTS